MMLDLLLERGIMMMIMTAIVISTLLLFSHPDLYSDFDYTISVNAAITTFVF
jgi:hypothetical protein